MRGKKDSSLASSLGGSKSTGRAEARNLMAGAVTDDSVVFGLLVFQNVQQLDLTGPYEVFASWPRARVRLVAKTLEPVVSSTGLVLKPDLSFDNAPQFDVVCVPGGSGINALVDDEATIAFVRVQAKGAGS
jgi:cyclohexyl-isocyanide hydratase